MPTLHFLIPDPALLAAVTEQAGLAEFGDVKTTAALEDDSAALVFDEAIDKKTIKLLRDALDGAGDKKPFTLCLGTTPVELAGYVSETLPKPLRLGALLARLQFHIQLAPRLRATPLAFGPYRLVPQNRHVVAEDGAIIRLTEKETTLLEYLGQSDVPVTRDELLAAVWGYEQGVDTHTLETHMYQLRRKLDPQGEGRWLINENGAYRLAR